MTSEPRANGKLEKSDHPVRGSRDYALPVTKGAINDLNSRADTHVRGFQIN